MRTLLVTIALVVCLGTTGIWAQAADAGSAGGKPAASGDAGSAAGGTGGGAPRLLPRRTISSDLRR
jgi:hypothetical protein